MRLLRIGLAQINPTVGDLQGNRDKIVAYMEQARDRGADVVAFPELAVCGYPPEDLVFKPSLDRKSTRLNSSHIQKSRMPSSA